MYKELKDIYHYFPIMIPIYWMEDEKMGQIVISLEDRGRMILDKDASTVWKELDGYSTVSRIIETTGISEDEVISILEELAEQELIVLKTLDARIWKSEGK
ncbi:hypothetical protein Psch_02829 [Pelotomaculum schinkii]|uniref:Coenzyme PQQ synthesis protein D (PqqD) n=1 Tax=Pelotomaculum schinkii TaxID=78350 RepID=A0A4Y7R9Z8_9FIRM|nr:MULTISPECIES: hypothetical protein [Pelotomaculum]TEB05788.1 hypothetical protein Psch_02829 [Pelotomaculum schinkii]TEB17955.1 hypothetical protein Psfp_00078 [Pelotomaculum sp. FP]